MLTCLELDHKAKSQALFNPSWENGKSMDLNWQVEEIRFSDAIIYSQQTCGRSCSVQIRPKFNFSANMQRAVCNGKRITCITHLSSVLWKMVVAVSCFGAAFLQQGLRCLSSSTLRLIIRERKSFSGCKISGIGEEFHRQAGEETWTYNQNCNGNV